MRRRPPLGVRWTIGDVAPRGFEALRLSVLGARRLFGPGADYVICVNTLSIDRARQLTGPLPRGIAWHDASRDLPAFLGCDAGVAEGVGWKLAPLRCFPDRRELALDNDVVLWALPAALRVWLDDSEGRALVAEDVRPCFGRFARLCGAEPRNTGVRGLPAAFDLERALRDVLDEHPGALTSELDEQGLQVAALSRAAGLHVVGVDDVTICSPFPPHLPHLGRAGAHFVGLNARTLPFRYYQRPAEEVRADHWDALRPELYRRLGLPEP
jgi:lambda repressor-like predicted transcriptional regulator